VSLEIFNALVFWFPAFLFSTTVHEAAHAWAALRGGDPTGYRNGQVSLSPWPHVRQSPLGMVVVPLVTSFTQGWTLGWASAPFDREWADRHPRRAAWMALAGPAGNLAIALAAFGLIRAGLLVGVFDAPARVTFDCLASSIVRHDPLGGCAFLARGLSVLLSLNAILFAFNLLPLPPLDGAAVITLPLPAALARRVRGVYAVPGLSFVGLLAAWQLCPALTRPVFDFVVGRLYPGQY
jgi:Zn-dependent protease